MSYQFSDRSRQKLIGVHGDLRRVVERAIELTGCDFMVFEGVRSLDTQRRYVSEGKSKTLNSRHLTGHAVDLVPLENGRPSWSWPLCRQVAAAVKQAARECGVAVEWGGDWRSFPDGAHFQLPRKSYPADPPSVAAAEPPADSVPRPTPKPSKAVTTVATAAGSTASAAVGIFQAVDDPAVQITLIAAGLLLLGGGIALALKKGWL